MRRNKQRELVVIAEDDATSRLAQGFLTNVQACHQNRYRIHKYGKGWKNAVEIALTQNLDRNVERYLLLVVDFDRQDERRYEKIVEELRGKIKSDRIFVLGAGDEAEPLCRDLRKYYNDATLTLEGAGAALARDCNENRRPSAWEEVESLTVNCPEVSRLESVVKPFLMLGAMLKKQGTRHCSISTPDLD